MQSITISYSIAGHFLSSQNIGEGREATARYRIINFYADLHIGWGHGDRKLHLNERKKITVFEIFWVYTVSQNFQYW